MTEILDTIREVSTILTVNRATTQTVVRGHVIEGRVAVLSVEGHMQPMDDRQLRYLPEGMNTLERHTIWSLQEIVVDDLVDDGSAPTIRVDRVKHWKEGPYWHAQGGKTNDVLLRTEAYELFGDATLPMPVGAGVMAHP
jgi:hypothetical protein